MTEALVILGSSGAGLSLGLAAQRAGYVVTVIEPDDSARERAEVFAKKDDPKAAVSLQFQSDPNAAGSAPLVFDATGAEDRAPFGPITPAGLVLTPQDNLDWMQAVSPAQCCRFVPFQPMQLRALTEVTPFAETTPCALTKASQFAEAIGRVPVTLPQGSGSFGLRLMDRLYATTDALLLQGAVLWDLDEALTSVGFDLGPYEAQDLIGLDVAYARRKALGQTSLIADRAVEEGRIGKKIGWGWYRYPGGGGAVIDPLIEDLVHEEAWFAKVTQRSFTAGDIVSAVVSALRDEARAIMADGDLADARDLARIAYHGLGVPLSLGIARELKPD